MGKAQSVLRLAHGVNFSTHTDALDQTTQGVSHNQQMKNKVHVCYDGAPCTGPQVNHQVKATNSLEREIERERAM